MSCQMDDGSIPSIQVESEGLADASNEMRIQRAARIQKPTIQKGRVDSVDNGRH